jgi:hypothetical protein
MKKEHKDIIKRFFELCQRSGEQVTTMYLSKLVARWFPEYRNLTKKEIEFNVATAIFC